MSREIPILFIHPWAEFYGAEKSLYLLVKELDREAFLPFALLAHEGPLWSRLESLGAAVSKAPLEPWFARDDSAQRALRWLAGLPGRVQRVVDAVERWDIRLIHSNVADILEGALAAALTGRPHVCSVRNNRLAHSWLKGLIPPESALEVVGALSQAVVPVTHAIRDTLSPLVAEEKLRVIHNCVDVRSFGDPAVPEAPGPELLPAATPEGPRVHSFGRVSPQKGYDLLIDAAALVAEARPEVRFSVFGSFQDGALHRSLLERLKGHGLSEAFRFEGHTERVKEELGRADLLVVSSREEGLALAAQEAMAAGKPVVSTRCGGPEEVILDGETGYIVPPDDPRALADAILKVLADPKNARQMGRKGRERVLRHFDIRDKTRQFESIYREVLEAHGARRAEDRAGEAILIETLLKTLDIYEGDLMEMGLRSGRLYHLERRLKGTWAYKAYSALRGPREGA